MRNRLPIYKLGFTIVELIVVISVIAILAAVTFVGYNGWRYSAISAQVKSDLQGAAAAMETARSFGEGYPESIPATYTPGEGVVLDGGSTDGETYCLTGTSTEDASIEFYITEASSNEPTQGACS